MSEDPLSFMARCDGCDGNARWTATPRATLSSVEPGRIRVGYRIDCETCGIADTPEVTVHTELRRIADVITGRTT
jgi:hypothetical protein